MGKVRKDVVIAAVTAVFAVISLVVMFLVLFAGVGRGEPPVICGVREEIVLYTDDDILAALTDGVYAVDQKGNTLPVEIAVYDGSGKLVAEYNESVGNVTKYQAGTYRVVYSCKSAKEVESVLVLYPEDKEPPVITGARDLTVTVGETISYRDGVTVTDNMDENVQLHVDAGQVNLEQPGTYPVTYWAEDSRGNRAEVTITVLVEEAPVEASEEPDPPEVAAAKRDLDELAASILSQITTPGMTKKQIARAIFDYVYYHVRYVGTSDKSSWVTGAYVGFTQGKGDCFNYFACSKELLTLAGIPNIDVSRVGGTTDHYWQLVNVGDGWYHFDACPHPTGYPITSFLLTEAEARAYTTRVSPVRKNYYVYDYNACPVTVVGTPEAEHQQPEQSHAVEPAPTPAPPTEQPAPPTEQIPTPELPAQEALEPEQPGGASGPGRGTSSDEERQ